MSVEIRQLKDENGQVFVPLTHWDAVSNKPDIALQSDIPTKTSQLTNDSSYVTEEEIAQLDLSTYAKDASLQEVEQRVDTSLDELLQEVLDNEYVTAGHIVSLHNDVSAIVADVSVLNSSIENIIISIPEKTSDLVNDSSFVIADELINVEYAVAMHITEMRADISTLKHDVSILQEYIINLEQRIIELENGN